MIDQKSLENMLRGLGIADERVQQAVPVLLGDADARGKTGGLLNIAQARAYLGGVSRWTIHRAIKGLELPPTRLGRRVLFARADLDRFIQAHRFRRVTTKIRE